MDYILLTCKITSGQLELAREILSQELADAGFESFEDTPSGLMAYIPQKDYSEGMISTLPSQILDLGAVSYSAEPIIGQNWNETWEKNFQPIWIANQCYIRAAFHEKKADAPYEIIIQPKMSFGTGHHETTSLMIEQMLTIDFKGKQILDMGCGTGILAIMASKLCAKHILAIDIDEWSYQNTTENCLVNHINNITAKQGDIDLIRGEQFEVILANINRNILLNQIPQYAQSITSNGLLLMSGIYQADFDVISQTAVQHGFKHLKTIEKNNWISLLFRAQS